MITNHIRLYLDPVRSGINVIDEKQTDRNATATAVSYDGR